MPGGQPKFAVRVAIDASPALRVPQLAPGRYAIELVDALSRSSDADVVVGTWSNRRLGPRTLMNRRELAQHFPDDLVEVWHRPPEGVDIFHSPGTSPHWPDHGVVVTVHGMTITMGFDVRDEESRTRLMRRAEHLLGHAARVQCASNTVALDLMDRYGVLRDRIDLVPPAVRSEFFTPNGVAPNLLDWPQRYLICYGAPAEARNVDAVLHAWADSPLRSSHTLVVLGGSAAADACDPIIQALGLDDDVFLPQVLLRADMPNALANSDGLVMPSNYEGNGLPLLEAMAAGVPVLTSREGTCEELTGGHALTVHGADLAGICRGMSRLVDDPPDVETARAWARSFDWAAHVWRVLASYERAAESGR